MALPTHASLWWVGITTLTPVFSGILMTLSHPLNPPAGQDPPERESPIRIEPLDGLRGIAALGIVGHHFLKVLLPDLGLRTAARTGLFSGGYLWVDLFFLLSGFVLTHVYGGRFFLKGPGRVSFRSFLVARFARIYPLHVVALTGFFALEISAYVFAALTKQTVGSPFQPPHRGLGSLASNLTLTQILTPSQTTTWNEPSWSISAEWIGYLLLPFAIPRLLRVKPCCGGLIAAGLLSLLVALERSFGHLDLAGYPGLIRCVAEMWLGVLLYRLHRSSLLESVRKSELLAALALGLSVWILHTRPNDVWFVLVSGLILLTAARNPGRIKRALGSRPLRRLGTISYSIYMTHWLVINVFRDGWAVFSDVPLGAGLDRTGTGSVLLLTLVSVLLISEFTFRWVEVPMRHRIRSIAARRGLG